MAHIVYICHRKKDNTSLNNDDFRKLSRNLTPNHIAASERTILSKDGISFSIISYNAAVLIKELSVALGNIESSTDWWEPGANVPDGAYALFRGDNELIELVTDVVASRSIWYIRTEEIFIASTSQRAIVACFGSYHPNVLVYPWILSSGCLGPDLSWDSRIKKMRGDSRVTLNRRTWELSEHIVPAHFEVRKRNDFEHERLLEDALNENFKWLDLDWDKWVLALSGGYDSRYSMMKLLEKGVDVKCITWCQKYSSNNKSSDAYIARVLANAHGFQHEYFFIDAHREPADQLLDRYIMIMEGRIDHIRANMDGFDRYKHLQKSGVIGLIRSDETLGHSAVYSEDHVRENVGLGILSDFSFSEALGLNEMIENQKIPDYLHQRENENYLTYRDRLQQEFRLPCINAALADSKLMYMEQSNPLISKRIVEVVRSLPDHLRINKSLFKNMVNNLVPDFPIATTGNTLKINNLLANDNAKDLFIRELRLCQEKAILPDKLINYCLYYLTNSRPKLNSSVSLKSKAGQILNNHFPKLRLNIRKVKKRSIPWETLVFRCFIISRMHGILQKDACLLRNN